MSLILSSLLRDCSNRRDPVVRSTVLTVGNVKLDAKALCLTCSCLECLSITARCLLCSHTSQIDTIILCRPDPSNQVGTLHKHLPDSGASRNRQDNYCDCPDCCPLEAEHGKEGTILREKTSMFVVGWKRRWLFCELEDRNIAEHLKHSDIRMHRMARDRPISAWPECRCS